MTNKCAFCNNTILPKEEINTKIYGKPVCNQRLCIIKANQEMQAATDAAMSPMDKVLSYLARENFKEQGMAKGLYIQDNSNIAVDLRELPPKIGVLIGGEIMATELNLKQEIENLKKEVDALKMSGWLMIVLVILIGVMMKWQK